MVSRPDGYGIEVETNKGAHPCVPLPNTNPIPLALKKKINSPQSNIDTGITVRKEDELEAQRIEEDAEAMLRLVDYIFFLNDREDIPS